MLDALSSSGKLSVRARAALPEDEDAQGVKRQTESSGPLVDLHARLANIEGRLARKL